METWAREGAFPSKVEEGSVGEKSSPSLAENRNWSIQKGTALTDACGGQALILQIQVPQKRTHRTSRGKGYAN